MCEEKEKEMKKRFSNKVFSVILILFVAVMAITQNKTVVKADTNRAAADVEERFEFIVHNGTYTAIVMENTTLDLPTIVRKLAESNPLVTVETISTITSDFNPAQIGVYDLTYELNDVLTSGNIIVANENTVISKQDSLVLFANNIKIHTNDVLIDKQDLIDRADAHSINLDTNAIEKLTIKDTDWGSFINTIGAQHVKFSTENGQDSIPIVVSIFND